MPAILLGLLIHQQLTLPQSPASTAIASADGRATSVNSARAQPTAGTAANDPACDPTAAPGAFADRVTEQRRLTEALAKTRAFDDWVTTWRRSNADESRPLIASGVAAAREYRNGLKELIELDPKRALERAVPAGLRRELPSEVAGLLEQRLDARGDLEVSVWHRGAEARYDRVARIAGAEYRAFVFGRRLGQASKSGLPLHGIAVDDLMAVDDLPYRFLDDAEKADAGVAFDTTAVYVADERLEFASHAGFAEFETRLRAAESIPGPAVNEVRPGATPPVAALTSPPAWINGAKRVLYLKIDFSDDAGPAFTDAEIQAGAAATSEYFVANSQGKTTFVASILPSTLRMPKPKSYYETSGSTNGELYTAARDAAKAYDAANGGTGAWDPDKFDRYIIVHKRISVYLYGGVAQTGGARVGLNNTVSAGTTGHELGHTQSLAHSHYWLPSGTSPVGAGSHIEYGDVFDIMGGGGATQHLNVSQKAKLGYLDAAAITTVTASGTYRIARHDDASSAGVRALRLAPAGMNYEYWVEHRRVAPTSFNAAQQDRLKNGVLIRWGAEKSPSFTSGQGSYLLDATPGSAGGANDAPLKIGETFVDPDAGISFKPLAIGGTAPNEYIDVQVGFGAVDGNRNPVIAADRPAGALTARSNVVFNATASDPDGDPLYFRWDFGDGQLQ
ncbi:MAG: PKD domain-containing protein, partial [Opitutaceae bacterium]